MSLTDIQLANDYDSYGSCFILSTIYNLPSVEIENRLFRLGKLYKPELCNNNLFSKCNDISLYWLGIIAGSKSTIIQKSSTIKIELPISRISLLYRFRRLLGYGGLIYPNKDSAFFYIQCVSIINDLNKIGIKCNKQGTIFVDLGQQILGCSSFRHFLRGYIDANSSFVNKSGKVSCSISGDNTFINKTYSILSDQYGIKPKKVKDKIVIPDRYIKQFQHLLYRSSYPENRFAKNLIVARKRKNITLGLDLSLNSTGFAVLKDSEYVCSGTIVPSKSITHAEKLCYIEETVGNVVDGYQPDSIVLENIYVKRNVKVFKILAMVHGVVIKRLLESGFPEPIQYTALEARKIVGTGKSKEEAFDFINNKFELNFVFERNDETDAILLALAGYINRI